MQSRNPVFARSEEFNGRATTSYPQAPGYGPGSGAAAGSDYGVPGQTHHEVGSGRMDIDSVVQKTGMTIGLVILVAAVTWVVTGDVVRTDSFGQPVMDDSKLSMLYTLSLVGALGGFVLAMVNSFKKVISPALVLAYAALEGVFIGAMSKTFQLSFGDGVVTGAVVGTVAAFAGTLAAYKFFHIKVSGKFRMWVTAMMFGFVGLTVLDLVLSFFKADFGFNGFGTMGLISSVVGLGLGVLMLILDFDYVERGIAAGLPERESWRAAFGLTVTLVWIYIELLRILAILTRR